ncbi:hypothetical protein, partial [Enterobacter hormaechei]|uniref:hypothetical protein n=1 Tax=Enterobacter hormaechei TaxID=158836 RepID=UPI0029499FBB
MLYLIVGAGQLDTAQLLVNQNSTDQKLAITHLLRAKNNLSELEDFAQARANLDVPSVEEVNNKLSGFGLAPIFPDTFYRFTHYWFAAADIPVANDIPVHCADAIRCNVR